MVVSVRFLGTQRTLTKTRKLRVELSDNGRVRDLCIFLKSRYPDLPLDEDDVLVTVNNTASTMNHSLKSNDKVAFLPHVGGG